MRILSGCPAFLSVCLLTLASSFNPCLRIVFLRPSSGKLVSLLSVQVHLDGLACPRFDGLLLSFSFTSTSFPLFLFCLVRPRMLHLLTFFCCYFRLSLCALSVCSEELEKQWAKERYRKLHEQGKTEEAGKDLGKNTWQVLTMPGGHDSGRSSCFVLGACGRESYTGCCLASR
jgi:hypothetical protein